MIAATCTCRDHRPPAGAWVTKQGRNRCRRQIRGPCPDFLGSVRREAAGKHGSVRSGPFSDDHSQEHRQLDERSRARSAVFDVLTHGVPVSIEVDAT
jgi:hypothetical protein